AGRIEEAERLLEEVFRHPSFTRSANDPRYRIISLKMRARKSFAAKRFADATDLYSEFLELDQQFGGSLPELVAMARGEEELGRDYRDAGIALINLGKRKAACDAWHRGSLERDDLGN